MFEIADIIKHKRTEEYFLVVDKHIYLSRNIERIEYTVVPVGAGGGVHIRVHYPLMTTNYEKIS